MTPTHNDTPTPLRRSGAGVFRTPLAPRPREPLVNDDEKERADARRKTILNESTNSTTIEDNEQLKECLKICTENKLTKENAWSISMIDTLSLLMKKHHKSLNNFKVAGSSLEASTKVYGLRVDSVHMDVVRMSAGLHKGKSVETDDHDNNNDNENDSQNQDNIDNQNSDEPAPQPKPKKKQKRQVSTVTKNKDTINGKLDTNPFTDPVFAKLNSIVGSINSSNRLMQNILPSAVSELRSKTDYKFWNSLEAVGEFDSSVETIQELNCITINAKILDDLNLEGALLRPNHTGYIITDQPAEQDESEINNKTSALNDLENVDDSTNMVMAFDINAEVEPITSEEPAFFDVDMDDFEDLTVDQQTAIRNCKGLRRNPIMIEDLAPVDSSASKLEYSYRPLDKISQYWAGPSHWKFKRSINKSISLSQRLTMNDKEINVKISSRKKKTVKLQPLLFTEINNDPFISVDENNKIRKSNIQKKWDSKKLKLPTDLQIDRNIFDSFQYATGFRRIDEGNTLLPNTETELEYDFNNQGDQDLCNNIAQNDDYQEEQLDHHNSHQSDEENDNAPNQTYAELSINLDNAPDKVEKIIVPFAKRAKVIDMKQLKKSSTELIQNEFIETNKENIPNTEQFPNEKYVSGVASFNKIYKKLPKLLNQNMAESLSPSIAFYAILHLANETNLRLFQHDNLQDFTIRKVQN